MLVLWQYVLSAVMSILTDVRRSVTIPVWSAVTPPPRERFYSRHRVLPPPTIKADTCMLQVPKWQRIWGNDYWCLRMFEHDVFEHYEGGFVFEHDVRVGVPT